MKSDEGQAAYVEKDLFGVSLKGVLQRGRLKLSRERVQWKRGVGFRPSDLTYPFCERLKVAQLAGLVDIYDERTTPRQQLVFDMGHAIHDIIQGYFWDIGLLKGSYKCLKCDKIYDDILAPTCCPSGKVTHEKKHLKYKEVRMRSEEYKINGRCDGILVIDGEEHLMDVKSIANRTPKSPEQTFCFEDLETKGPKHDHIVQLNLYMWISGIHRGHLLYVAKNNHQIKTFAIPYDYSILKPYLDNIKRLLDLAMDLQAHKRVELPEVCSRANCPCEQV